MREVNETGACGGSMVPFGSLVPLSCPCLSISYCLRSPLVKTCSVSEVNVQRTSAAGSVVFIVTRHCCSEGITVMCIVVLLRMSFPVFDIFILLDRAPHLFLFISSFLTATFIFLLFVAISLLCPVVSSSVLREQRRSWKEVETVKAERRCSWLTAFVEGR